MVKISTVAFSNQQRINGIASVELKKRDKQEEDEEEEEEEEYDDGGAKEIGRKKPQPKGDNNGEVVQ